LKARHQQQSSKRALCFNSKLRTVSH